MGDAFFPNARPFGIPSKERVLMTPEEAEGPPGPVKRALLIVDVQNDFCPGGSLAVANGDEVIPAINKVRAKAHFDHVFLTKDWHPADHISFAVNHPGHKEFETIKIDGEDQTLWPVHCVQGSYGAKFVQSLTVEVSDVTVYKGAHPMHDSYSGFWDNAKKHKTELDTKLKEKGITDIFICGLAVDYCVGWSALHARELGYRTYVLIDASKGIDEIQTRQMSQRLEEAGVILTSTRKVILNWKI